MLSEEDRQHAFIIWKFGHVIFELCERTVRHTDRHTHRNVSRPPCEGLSISDLLLLTLLRLRSRRRRKSAAVMDVLLGADAPLTIVGFIENDHDILYKISVNHLPTGLAKAQTRIYSDVGRRRSL